MKVPKFLIVILSPAVVTSMSSSTSNFAKPCYDDPIPLLPPSPANRPIPWGKPDFKNGSRICCKSLDEVRAGIDSVDQRLLELLSQRAGLVREATRFKATLDSVDVPARDEQVIEGAEANASAVHLPKIIAKDVFAAIINASVKFERCVFNSFDGGH